MARHDHNMTGLLDDEKRSVSTSKKYLVQMVNQESRL